MTRTTNLTLTLLLGLFLAGSVHAEQVYIRANQLGYTPSDLKTGLAFSLGELPETFDVLDLHNARVFQAKTKPLSGVPWGQFKQHAELDFSRLDKPGRYVLQVGAVRSLPFEISSRTYPLLPDQLLEFMRQQRCGYNPWLDVVCHAYDGRTAYGPLTNGSYLDARGGWHDAGDLLKYLLTSGNATAQMLLGYQICAGDERHKNGEVFADRFNALGQSGANGIPDLL